jgi:type VI secretion system Hcp family effector
MALNAYLSLKLNGADVDGSVTQKGREDTIMVTSLEWSFDSDGNVGEVRFTVEADDESLVPMSNGLKSNQSVEASFDFYTASQTGVEVKYLTLHGVNGRITSSNMWMLNNKDPNLTRYETTIQYTMSFPTITETQHVPTSRSVTIP